MRELIKEIWSTSKRNKLRTSLTGFAVAWGIFMLIFLLGAGNGLINAQLQQSDRRLSTSMQVYGGYTSKAYRGLKEGRDIQLRTQDLDITNRAFSDKRAGNPERGGDSQACQIYAWNQSASGIWRTGYRTSDQSVKRRSNDYHWYTGTYYGSSAAQNDPL